MSNVVSQTIYGSSLVFYPGDRPTNTGTTLPIQESYLLDASGVTIYANNVNPTPKIFKNFSIEPVWAVNDITPSTVGAYNFHFKICECAAYIASKPANDLTQNFYAFSSYTADSLTVNQYGPQTSKVSVNDFHADFPFVLQPYETLKFKIRNVNLDNNLPSNTLGNTARYNAWTQQWSPHPAVKVRTEWEEFDDSVTFYGKIGLNDLPVAGDTISTDQDITLLDLTEGSPTLLTKPFTNLFNNSFKINVLNLLGAYPWEQSPTKFMYSIILQNERRPAEDYFVRKYTRFFGDDGTGYADAEGTDLLKDTGPVFMKRGQKLIVRIYSHEATFDNSNLKVIDGRQMPGFWLNGNIT